MNCWGRLLMKKHKDNTATKKVSNMSDYDILLTYPVIFGSYFSSCL